MQLQIFSTVVSMPHFEHAPWDQQNTEKAGCSRNCRRDELDFEHWLPVIRSESFRPVCPSTKGPDWRLSKAPAGVSFPSPSWTWHIPCFFWNGSSDPSHKTGRTDVLTEAKHEEGRAR